MTEQLLFWVLAALAGVGAVTVVLTRDVMRMTLGLGAFLLAVAGFFALFGFGFLALAELFVYVGGVLVLVLFAVMLVHRSEPGSPSIETRHDLLAAIASAGVFGFVSTLLRPIAPALSAVENSSAAELGGVLLGELLSHFELAGVLLLAALVAVVAVAGGERE